MVKYADNMLNLFFPKVCRGCQKELTSGETVICAYCRHKLPLTNFHKTNSDQLKRLFYGRIPIENATALFYFYKKGVSQKYIHALKYKGAEEIGTFFGKWLGQELAATSAYQNVDLIIPVPLHKKKLRKRGYNQVAAFARELAIALQKPYKENILVKITPTQSQVFKDRLTRIFSYKEVFSVQQFKKLIDKHILLVDDVVTTGATLEACAQQLRKAKNVKISIATIGMAD